MKENFNFNKKYRVYMNRIKNHNKRNKFNNKKITMKLIYRFHWEIKMIVTQIKSMKYRRKYFFKMKILKNPIYFIIKNIKLIIRNILVMIQILVN